MNRRTSIYTIRVADSAAADLVAAELRRFGIPINDHGDAAVSFRASSDGAALRVTDDACYTLGAASVTLTTGLGIHRREVVGA